MASNFPTSLDALINPTATDQVAVIDHALQHTNANDAIEALQVKVGINGSAVTTTHDYKLSEVTSTDKSVGKSATQTLTNKTIDADSNTITNIDNGNIKSGADIARAKLASGTAGAVLINDGSGVMSEEAQLDISRGGTGQGTPTDAFDALAPTTTKGDLIVHDGTDNIRVGVGANNTIPVADSSEPSGIKWALVGTLGLTKLSIDTTQQTFNVSGTSATTQTLYTVAIPANTIGTNNSIRFKLINARATIGVGTGDCYITATYGGQTVFTTAYFASASSSSFTDAPLILDAYITGNGTTSSQKNDVQYINVSYSSSITTPSCKYTATTVDTTVSQNLVISATLQSSSSNGSFTCEGIIIELIA